MVPSLHVVVIRTKAVINDLDDACPSTVSSLRRTRTPCSQIVLFDLYDCLSPRYYFLTYTHAAFVHTLLHSLFFCSTHTPISLPALQRIGLLVM